MSFPRRLLPISLFLMCLAAGCSEPRATVTGTVRFDGEPLAHGAVQFWPKEDLELGVYGGKTDEQGRFEMRFRGEKCVKPGTYLVVIAKDVKQDGKVPDEKEDQMLLARPGALHNSLPPKYFDRKNPLFVVRIEPGPNEVGPFELTSK